MKKGRELFIILSVLSIPLLHEVGHFIGYTIDRVPATIKYGFTISENLTFLGVLGGPLFNISLSLICITLIYLDSKRRVFWGIIGLASSVSRLLNCVIIFIIGIFFNPMILHNNDEGQLAILINSNIYILYIMFLAIYFYLTLLIIKLIKNNTLCAQLSYRIIGYNLIITLFLIFL